MSKKTVSIIRWILVAPVWFITWWAILTMAMETGIAIYRILQIPLSVLPVFIGMAIAVIGQAAAVYAVAPDYKKKAALVAGVCALIWAGFILYGMSHMAY